LSWPVIPAKAGIQVVGCAALDSRLRGNDKPARRLTTRVGYFLPGTGFLPTILAEEKGPPRESLLARSFFAFHARDSAPETPLVSTPFALTGPGERVKSGPMEAKRS
jgi:hypothetical protein